MNLNNQCPFCGYHTDQVTSIKDTEFDNTVKPNEGDINICLKCGKPSTYGADLKLRKMNKKELIELQKEEPELFQQMAVASYVATYLPKKERNN